MERHEVTGEQFGSRAPAYVASTVHAQGDDLQDLVEHLRGRTGAHVLDLGCGGGHVSFSVAPYVAEVVAYDVAAGMLEAVTAIARERGLRNIKTVQGPAERMPFPDASFDVVLTRFSAHHWTDLSAGLREARRVLNPSGDATFIDVIAPEAAGLDTFLQAIELLRDQSHVRDYSERDWTTALGAAGFAVESTVKRRLRMDFSSWIARTQTPAVNVAAIRALQAAAIQDVARYFEIEPDGSFTFDTAAIATARRSVV